MNFKELIDETVEYYGNHLRAVSGATRACHYRGDNGAMCAVGRCMTEASLHMFGNFVGDVDELSDNADAPINGLVKEEYQTITNIMWQSLQNLHDSDTYWVRDEVGQGSTLSENGEAYVRRLKEDV